MTEELEFLYHLILDCNAVSILRGDKYGLCDCIDNEGDIYQSETMAKIIKKAIEFEESTDTIPFWRNRLEIEK